MLDRKLTAVGLKSSISDFHPAYFAMVMSTGIISISSHLLEYHKIAEALVWLNFLFYFILWAITFTRILVYPKKILSDLSDHVRGVGFFSLVAGTCILGTQILVHFEAYDTAFIFLILGVILWIFFIYFVLTSLAVKEIKPSLEAGISGLWLLIVVSTQSISILSALLVPRRVKFPDEILFFALAMFLLGGMLYLVIINLIFYRLMFFKLNPESFYPNYWVNMGAVAISTLAGSTLTLNNSGSSILEQFIPFIKGLTLFFWAGATWWIPLLVMLEIWRHVINRIKISYSPQYWGLVFPLGMYTASTLRLSEAMNLEFLAVIPRYFFFVALLAWVITLIGLFKTLSRSIFHSRPETLSAEQ